MGAFWDIVGKVANLVQLFGLDAITLITMASSFLWFHEITEMECRKLEERVRMLSVILHSPAGRWIMIQQQQQQLELVHLVTNVLKDAHDLIEFYNKSTLLARVRRGRSMARQFRDLRGSIDSYCGLILSVNAFFLAVQGNLHPPLHVRTDEVNDVGVTQWSRDSKDVETTTPAPAPGDTHIIDISHSD